jgi:ribosomal protein S18 acetylase RimI-like enzyme
VTFLTTPARPPANPWAGGLHVRDWETWLEPENRFAWILADGTRVGAVRWYRDEVTQVVGLGAAEPAPDASEYALMWLKPRVIQIYSFQPGVVAAATRLGMQMGHEVFQLRGRLDASWRHDLPELVPITPQLAETAGRVYDQAFRAKQGRRIVWQYLQQFETASGLLWRQQGRPVALYMDRLNPNGEVQVVWLGVLADFRRRGIGRRLVQAGLAARRAEGRTSAVVQVEGGNAPALRFYEGMGFEWEWTRTRAELG